MKVKMKVKMILRLMLPTPSLLTAMPLTTLLAMTYLTKRMLLMIKLIIQTVLTLMKTAARQQMIQVKKMTVKIPLMQVMLVKMVPQVQSRLSPQNLKLRLRNRK